MRPITLDRKDWDRPCVGVARWDEYVQTTREGEPTSFWKRMPHNQLAKCAEAAALRKAFPKPLSKIYIPEEIQENETVDVPPARQLAKAADQPKPIDHAAAIASADTLEKLQLAIDAIKADLKAGRISTVVANTLAGATRARREKIEGASAPKPEVAQQVATGTGEPGVDDPDLGP